MVFSAQLGCSPEVDRTVQYVAVRNQRVAATLPPASQRKSLVRSAGTLHNVSSPAAGLPRPVSGAATPRLTSTETGPWDRLEGLQSLSRFGHSVSEAGDVNGDGFADVVIGAPGAGKDKSGSVHLYFGGAGGISKSIGWTYDSPMLRAELGHQVAGAGDVNGDGYDDLVVGATYDTDPGHPERTGSALVFQGGPNGPAGKPDWQVFGTATGNNTGFSVGAAGDVNGDGFDDVLVGSWNAETNPLVKDLRKGSAALYLGGPDGLSRVPAWQPEGEKDGSHYGYSLHGLGDVNGDGFGDVAVGAWGFESERPESGRVYVYLGGPSGPPPNPSWVLSGLHEQQRLGASVFPAGDVNGDGFSDLLVGATGASNPESSEGQILLFLGGPSGLSTEADWTFEPNFPSWSAGHSVATAGDLNGDGISDFVVSSMVGQVQLPKEGMAFVFLGSRSGPARSPDWVFAGGEPNGGYGATVRPAGDVDRDGYDDLLVGQTYHTGQLFQQGAAWIHYGGPAGLREGLQWQRGIENLGFRYRSVTLPMPTFLGRAALGGLMVLSAVLAGFGVHRRTVRKRQALQKAEETAQQAERARLSQDLHDQLGADITHLVIMSSVVRRNLTSGKSAEEALFRMEAVSRGLMDSLAEIVWLTQPQNDRLERVAGYLGDLAQKMLEPAEIRCLLEIPESLPDVPIPYDCRHDLVLAVREALSNALRHSGTQTIRVCVRAEPQGLTLDVEDFGTGFSAGKPKARGHGLQNLSNRLERHGGTVEIQTGPKGTRVSLRLPLTPAPST